MPCLREGKPQAMTITSQHVIRHCRLYQHTVWSHFQTIRLSIIDSDLHLRGQERCTRRGRQKPTVARIPWMSQSDM